MTTNASRNDNHYVPHVYLKNWKSSHERIWTYRLLVSHDAVPLWKETSIRGIAYHSHLYTSMVAGEESDEIEQWLDREFEAPADEALRKVTSDERLTETDWHNLVRFLAAQDVRTPARLMEDLKRWSTTLPRMIESSLKEAVTKLELAHRTGEIITAPTIAKKDYIPFRLTTNIEPGQEIGTLKGETIAGRGLWLFGIKHILTDTVNALFKYRWTILTPPKGLNWFTSDDPAIRLNFFGPDRYDFQGGWGKPGTDIMLPLSPRHLLFTQVGKKPPRRGTVLSREKAVMLRRIIAEHAHRMIFSSEIDNDVPTFRPRVVDLSAFNNEKQQWRKWHAEQTAAEQELMGRKEI
jgi:hypothetical protein